MDQNKACEDMYYLVPLFWPLHKMGLTYMVTYLSLGSLRYHCLASRSPYETDSIMCPSVCNRSPLPTFRAPWSALCNVLMASDACNHNCLGLICVLPWPMSSSVVWWPRQLLTALLHMNESHFLLNTHLKYFPNLFHRYDFQSMVLFSQ